ncbi:hypothetical protein JCM10213_005137 [Rhodosporidiobolus nylandii]
MLDRLLPELLDHVLSLAVSGAGAKERNETLRACSLVSRAVSARAVPLLWRVIELRQNKQALALEAVIRDKSFTELSQATRGLVLDGRGDFKLEKAMPLLRRFSRLKNISLSIFHEDKVDGAELERFPGLRRLDLHSVLLLDLPFRLAGLVELAISSVEMNSSSLTSILSPSSFPVLRALAVSECFDPTSEDSHFIPLVPPAMLEQLDMLQIGTTLPSYLPPKLEDYTTPVLFTLVWSFMADFHTVKEFDEHPVRHLRLVSDSLKRPGKGTLYQALHLLTFGLPMLSSLHLPAFLQQPDESAAYIMFLKQVLEDSTRMGIEVLWHDDGHKQHTISPDFWAYAKELKAAQQTNSAA